MPQLIKQTEYVRGLARELWNTAKEAHAANDYAKEEKYLLTPLNLGRLLNQPQRMLIVRMTGMALQFRSLKSMLELYQATNKPEQAKAAQDELDKVNQQGDEIKKVASGGSHK